MTQGVYAVFFVAVSEVDQAGISVFFDASKIAIAVSGLDRVIGHRCSYEADQVNCFAPYLSISGGPDPSHGQLQIDTSAVAPGSYTLTVTARDTATGSSASATVTLNVLPSGTGSEILVHSSRTISWFARSDIYDCYKNDFAIYYDFTQSAYDQIEQFLGLSTPVEVHIESSWSYGGSSSSGGRVNVPYAMLVSTAAITIPTFPAGPPRLANEWAYSVIINEMVNVFTGRLTGDWPCDWWADGAVAACAEAERAGNHIGRSPFPAMVTMKVLEVFDPNLAAIQDRSLAPDPLYGMFKSFEQLYGRGMFQRAFSMMHQDGMDLSNIGSNPSSLKSHYVAFYLSEGAGADLSSQLNAAFSSTNPPIAYSIDPTTISGIRNARNTIYQANNTISVASNLGLDVTPAQSDLARAWDSYRAGDYSSATSLAQSAINAANTATTTATTTTTTATPTLYMVTVYTRKTDGSAITGAFVALGSQTKVTDSSGKADFSVSPETYSLQVQSPVSGESGLRYVFTHWTDGNVQYATTISISASVTYDARYKTQCQLTMQANPSGGTTNPAVGTYWYDSGSSVTISATPNGGYAFSSWSGSGMNSYTGVSNPSSVVVNGPITEAANFVQTTTVTTTTNTTTSLFHLGGYVFGNGQPILGATVTASSPSYTQPVTTLTGGFWEMLLPYGSYTLTFSASGYRSQSTQIVISPDSAMSYGSVNLEPETTTTTATQTTMSTPTTSISATPLTTSTTSETTTVTASTTVSTIVAVSSSVTYGAMVTTTAQGMVVQVVSNSSVSSLLFDSTRSLLNFTVSGPTGSVGFFDAEIAKSLLSGQPIVMMDGLQHTASVSQDASYWYVHVTYPHSEHHVTIGGSGTIPEFRQVTSLLGLSFSLALVLIRAHRKRRN